MSKKPTITELEQKIGELTEALQRERADAVNLRRRAEEDKVKLGDFYKVMILREFLPALDNLERALKHYPQKDWDLGDEKHEWVKGVKKIYEQFEASLAQLGVERVDAKPGTLFDPRLHEAVHMEDGEGSVEVVCEELQPGYIVGDDVIRHAMVKVKMSPARGKNPEDSADGNRASNGLEKK